MSLSSLAHGAHILEIGCGAGQATGLFSAIQPVQTSIDIGPRLIDQCRSQFGEFTNYEFICTSFEDHVGPDEGYDLIYAATCFHWISPGIRFAKSYKLLKSCGHLAVFSDKHIKNRDGFFAEVQGCYTKHAPELAASSKRSKNVPVGPGEPTEPEEKLLMLNTYREYDRELRYTADEYVGLLKTFSGHIALGEDKLKSLCDSIHSLISTRYQGVVLKILTTRLRLYEKAQPDASRDPFGDRGLNVGRHT